MEPVNAIRNADEYPKIFRDSLTIRLFLIFIGLLVSYRAMAMLLLLDKGHVGVIPYLIFGIIELTVVIMMISVWTSKVTLYSDRVDKSMLFRSKVMSRSTILGYRLRGAKNSKLLELVPANNQLKAMSMSNRYANDPLFKTWLQGLRNLDEEDQNVIDQEIANDVRLGVTPEERLAKVATLRKTQNFLLIGTILVVIGLTVFPHPLWLAVAVPVLSPWIALGMVALWGESFTIFIFSLDKKVALRKASLLPLVAFPSVSFMLASLHPQGGLPHFPLNWHPLLIPSTVGGVLMAVVILMIDNEKKTNLPSLIGMLLISTTIYAANTLVFTNGLLDHQPASNYTLTVMKKYFTTGKHAAHYFDVMSADKRYDGDTTITVDPSFYASTQVNGTVCAQIHPGALGMKWETVDRCQ